MINVKQVTMNTDKELFIAAVLFLLLHPMSLTKEPAAKRERKALLRSLNRLLATARNDMDNVRYLKIVHEASDACIAAFEKMTLRSCTKERLTAVSPSGLIDAFKYRNIDLIKLVNIPEEHMRSMRIIYSDSNLAFPSLMYANRIIFEMEERIDKIDELDDNAIVQKSRKLVEAHAA